MNERDVRDLSLFELRADDPNSWVRVPMPDDLVYHQGLRATLERLARAQGVKIRTSRDGYGLRVWRITPTEDVSVNYPGVTRAMLKAGASAGAVGENVALNVWLAMETERRQAEAREKGA